MVHRILLLTCVGTVAALSSNEPASAQKREFTYAQTDQSASFPAGFQGRVSYSGTYDGRLTIPGPPLRRLDVASILRTATGGSTREFAGGYKVEIQVDGNAVTGRYSGSGGIDTVTFSGTRSGSRCRLFDDRSGAAIDAECSAQRFAGTVQSPKGARQPYKINFETDMVRLVDGAQEARERQLAAAQAAARQQQAEAIRAENNRLVNGAAPLERRMEAVAEIDSRSWLAWSYAPGSMANVRREAVRNARNYTAVGTFRYGDGRPGSLRAEVRNGTFACLQFGNESRCRPVGHPESHDIAAGLLGAFMSGGGGGGAGGGGGQSNNDAAFDAWQQGQDAARASQQPPPPEPAPVTPIGGDHGLYGNDHSCCSPN